MANDYPLGTVSEGTMRNEDLIPAFADTLERYAPERYAEIRAAFADIFAEMDADDFEDFEDQEAAGYLTDTLFDALDAIAAPYTYFGSTEGDGADYGFWPSMDSLEEDARYGEGVVKVNAGDRWEWNARNGCALTWPNGDDKAPSVAHADYVMAVTDHGNVTLYDARTRAEIWSVA